MKNKNKDFYYLVTISILLTFIAFSYSIGSFIGYYQGSIDSYEIYKKDYNDNYSNDCIIKNSDFSKITYEDYQSFKNSNYSCTIKNCIYDNYCKNIRIRLKLEN